MISFIKKPCHDFLDVTLCFCRISTSIQCCSTEQKKSNSLTVEDHPIIVKFLLLRTRARSSKLCRSKYCLLYFFCLTMKENASPAGHRTILSLPSIAPNKTNAKMYHLRSFAQTFFKKQSHLPVARPKSSHYTDDAKQC